MTLTTQTPWQQLDPADFREGMAAVLKRLRRRYGSVEYFAAVEFTTGKAVRSGGQRRMHGHVLLKFGAGVDVDVIEAEQLVRETWRQSTGAYVVEVAALVSPGAALGYLGLHHRKPEQAPPPSWRGMTERASRRYWHRPIAELRDVAKAELRAEAHAWRTGTSVEVAALDLAAAAPPLLRKVRRRHGRELLDPQGAPSWTWGSSDVPDDALKLGREAAAPATARDVTARVDQWPPTMAGAAEGCPEGHPGRRPGGS